MDEIAEEVIAITSNHEIEIEKNFKLIGGPGAGKTQFIINHIRNIVHNSKRLKKKKKIFLILEIIVKKSMINISSKTRDLLLMI